MHIKGLLIMVVIMVVQAAVIEVQDEVLYELVCENEDMYLQCPKGYTIEIVSAMFGKKNYKYCYQPGLQIENCEAKNSSIILENMCNLRQRCHLSAHTDLFGDPCGGDTYKYLEVAYSCLKNNDIISSPTVCEHEDFAIECPLGKRIKIVNAFYGRKSGIKCIRENREYRSLKCDSKTALQVMASKCDNFNKCRLSINNMLFGDPCISSTYKYFELDYLCQEPLRSVSCEHEIISLSCEKGYINILDALFGRKNTKYCNQPGNHVLNCEATRTLDLMKFKCDFQRKCSVEVDTKAFGDPCPGTWKYLEVAYECVNVPTMNTAIACEHDQLQISCPIGYFLWIGHALFGRKHPTHCYKPPKAVVNNICEANNAFDVVEYRCQNTNQCTVNASVQIFGDPCYYSYKYLQVDYQCKSHQRVWEY